TGRWPSKDWRGIALSLTYTHSCLKMYVEREVVQTWRRKMCETPPKPERLRLKTCRLFRRDGCSPRGMKSTRTTRMTSWLSTTQIVKEANPTKKTTSGRRTETGIMWRGSRSTLLYLVTTTTNK
ncbi:unnamed protein product, partial [Scytosiphon promiscuus]